MQQQGRQVGRAVIARFVVVGQVYEAGGADLIQNNADVFGDIADAIDADDITDAQAMQRPDIKCAFDDIDLAAGAGDLMLEVVQRADIVEGLVLLLPAVLPSDFALLFALYFECLQQTAAGGARAAISSPCAPDQHILPGPLLALHPGAGGDGWSEDAAREEIC